MQPYCMLLAKRMLDIEEGHPLPMDLYGMLDDANKYCEKTGGALISRQVVASIIVFWENK